MLKRNYAKREEKEYNFWVENFQRWAIVLFVIPYIRLKHNLVITGRENIPNDESFILAPTHTNNLDPLLAYYATKRPAAFMAKKELFENFWLGHLIAALGAFSVNREKLEIATIKTAQMIIKTKKWILSLFPQGSRDKACKITKLTPGFAYFARVAKSKILPVSIILKKVEREDKGIFAKIKTLFDKTPITSKFSSSYFVYEVKIGQPIDYSKNLADTMENWCNAIVSLGGYTVDECIKEKIKHEREKELSGKNESTASES